jgi:hypothetical protein
MAAFGMPMDVPKANRPNPDQTIGFPSLHVTWNVIEQKKNILSRWDGKCSSSGSVKSRKPNSSQRAFKPLWMNPKFRSTGRAAHDRLNEESTKIKLKDSSA